MGKGSRQKTVVTKRSEYRLQSGSALCFRCVYFVEYYPTKVGTLNARYLQPSAPSPVTPYAILFSGSLE
jgi:hypothetical protein